MTHTYIDQTFDGLGNDGRGLFISDLRVVRCSFRACHLSTVADPAVRAVVRNVQLTDCRVFGESCTVSGAVIEDCVVDGFSADGVMFLVGCAYKHAIIRGNISPLVLDNRVIYTWISDEIKDRFVEANTKYYGTVDWALDIPEAKSNDMDIRGIPSSLIRRDPRTQVVATQERVREQRWSKLDLDQRVRLWLNDLVRRGWSDSIFIVPDKHPRRQRMLDSLAKLRELGIAE